MAKGVKYVIFPAALSHSLVSCRFLKHLLVPASEMSGFAFVFVIFGSKYKSFRVYNLLVGVRKQFVDLTTLFFTMCEVSD